MKCQNCILRLISHLDRSFTQETDHRLYQFLQIPEVLELLGETLNQDGVAETDLFLVRIALERLLLQTCEDSCLCAVVANGNECLFCFRRDEVVRVG